MTSKKRYLRIALATAFSVAFAAGSSIAADVDGNRLLNADKELERQLDDAITVPTSRGTTARSIRSTPETSAS